jgi:hypothetical protein
MRRNRGRGVRVDVEVHVIPAQVKPGFLIASGIFKII